MDRINLTAIFNISIKFVPTDRPTIFRTLYVPQKLFLIYYQRKREHRQKEQHTEERDRRNFAVYEHVVRYARRQYILTASQRRNARCIYASRHGVGNAGGIISDGVQNEGDVEDLYRSYGFFIATPGPEGLWTFEEEVAHYNSAYMLAGFEGSNLHNSVFMKPGGTLILMQSVSYKGWDPGLENQAVLVGMNNLTAHSIDL